jgi:hypothetical protein
VPAPYDFVSQEFDEMVRDLGDGDGEFFANDGVVFWPILSLHGDQNCQATPRRRWGPEVEIGKPILNLNRIQRHRVVITNYQTVKNYQHSFAYIKNGEPLWSFIASREPTS